MPKRKQVLKTTRGSRRVERLLDRGDRSRSAASAHVRDATVFGDFTLDGFDFEWVDFEGSRRSVAEDRDGDPFLQIVFNLEGEGEVSCAGNAQTVEPDSVWVTSIGDSEIGMTRTSGKRHRFLTLRFSPEFLTEHLPMKSGNLHPVVQSACIRNERRSIVGDSSRLTTAIRAEVERIRKPPVLKVAQPMWFRAKALELACIFFFVVPDRELFCHRQNRLAHERASRVKELLIENLCEPPGLKELGQKVGCSPYYLSRIFSREVGMTIPQYLRKLRIERAAELLSEGSLNVTEVALEVGYNSISHFSQAFCHVIGCCPAMYPIKRV